VSAARAAGERIPVLTFLSNFLIGGTERQVLNLISNHDRSRFDVHLACFRRQGPLLRELDARRVSLSEYPIATLASARALAQQLRLAREMRRNRIRVVHAFGYYPIVFAVPAARLAGVPLVVASVRDTGDHLSGSQRRLQRWACAGSHHVLVNAQAVRDALAAQGYAARRISVIPNGIDMARFQPRAEADDPIVAVFSRLNPLKGIEYFLEAAARLLPRFPRARFWIVGDSVAPGYRARLAAQALGLGLRERVAFLGFRDDVPALLRQVSVSVLPSLSEGLSNVVLEAMAAGVPVVATAVGGTPELIRDGETGLLVPARDSRALERAVGSLLEDHARASALGAAARLEAGRRFSLQAMVRETERLYEDLLQTRFEPVAARWSVPLGRPAR
jgi:glycosyltransferase involved in cell wall biosynthesis